MRNTGVALIVTSTTYSSESHIPGPPSGLAKIEHLHSDHESKYTYLEGDKTVILTLNLTMVHPFRSPFSFRIAMDSA